MTSSSVDMENVVDVSDLGLKVGHPNGTQVVVTSIGSLNLFDKVILHDVLIVP